VYAGGDGFAMVVLVVLILPVVVLVVVVISLKSLSLWLRLGAVVNGSSVGIVLVEVVLWTVLTNEI
jgi:hypothetical protein